MWLGRRRTRVPPRQRLASTATAKRRRGRAASPPGFMPSASSPPTAVAPARPRTGKLATSSSAWRPGSASHKVLKHPRKGTMRARIMGGLAQLLMTTGAPCASDCSPRGPLHASLHPNLSRGVRRGHAQVWREASVPSVPRRTATRIRAAAR
jgi:hypothetical protein